ncbi:MAG: shikimate kinase [Acidobacteria bacterium]|nr:shikimate kinase [Acidobacteriota bacterium]MCW5967318.1 shikimate kinase [Blastocatellales bacterium]
MTPAAPPDPVAESPIFLLGFMGSGKSTIGASLGAILKRTFIDLDKVVVETCGKPIHQIIAEDGEARFRRLEHEALVRSSLSPAVVATGGGVVTLPENLGLMNDRGITVFLDAPFAMCWNRILNDGVIRPLAPDYDTALERFNSRRSLYEQAKLQIPISSESAMENAEIVAKELIKYELIQTTLHLDIKER